MHCRNVCKHMKLMQLRCAYVACKYKGQYWCKLHFLCMALLFLTLQMECCQCNRDGVPKTLRPHCRSIVCSHGGAAQLRGVSSSNGTVENGPGLLHLRRLAGRSWQQQLPPAHSVEGRFSSQWPGLPHRKSHRPILQWPHHPGCHW